MGKAIRHHLVSKGYLKAWSHPGRRIALIDKATLTMQPVGINDAFVAPKALTFSTPDGPSDALETEFGRIESQTLLHVRRFNNGERDGTSEVSVKALIALHWARSQSLMDTYDRIFKAVTLDLAGSAESDVEMRDAFQQQHGRQPNSGELHQLVLTRSDEWRRTNTFFAERVQHYYNRAIHNFDGKHLQRITNRGRVEFLIADAPVVLLTGPGALRGTAENPCALLEATSLWFPLAPHVGVTLTEQPQPDKYVSPADAQQLNMISWRYAKARLAGSLHADLDLALVRQPGTITRRQRADGHQPTRGTRR